MIIAAAWGLIKWNAEPRSGHAQAPPPPDVAIVFVLDGSPTMFPPISSLFLDDADFFEFGKETIAEFLSLPGFDPDSGAYEVGVIQFAQMGRAAYEEGTHWLDIAQITTAAQRDALLDDIHQLEPGTHFTNALLEGGIYEGRTMLAGSSATERHLVLLTTGEYRLPEPCPSGLYASSWTSPDNVPFPTTPDADGCENQDRRDECLGECNRVCQVRYEAEQARQAGIVVSAVRLGPDWVNRIDFGGRECEESFEPYEYEDYNAASTVFTRDTPPLPADPAYFCYDDEYGPMQPDREGFLKEITNAGGECDPAPPNDEPTGNFARIRPFYESSSLDGSSQGSFQDPEATQPDTPYAAAKRISSWFCVPGCVEADDDGSGGDGVCDLCDNCPNDKNPRQRDCDQNRIGDVCQYGIPESGAAGDTDGDGVPDTDDVCDGGDDCFVNEWLIGLTCDDGTSACLCDCNHNCEIDACEAAIELDNLPIATTDADEDGVPDCCASGSCGVNSDQACNGVPEQCDTPEIAAAHIDGDYVEDFDTFDGEQFATSATNADGWWISETSYGADVTTSPGTADELSITAADALSAGTWLLETPGFHLPLGGCLRTACDFPRRGPWSIAAVDITLKYTDGGAGASAQSEFDIYFMDPAKTDYAEATRARLRIVPDASNSTKAQIEYQWPTVGDEQPRFSKLRTFDRGEWATITVTFNAAALYFNHNEIGCAWNGGGADTVTYTYDSASVANPVTAGPRPELSAHEPDVPRGLQLQFAVVAPSATGSAEQLHIQEIRLRPSDPCEWRDAVGICSASEYCGCGFSTVARRPVFQCYGGTCGNWTLETGEQCDPPDGAHCDETCHWICGDPIIQTDQLGTTQSCDWFINPVDGCGPGTETCQLPEGRLVRFGELVLWVPAYWDPAAPCETHCSGWCTEIDWTPCCGVLAARGFVCGDGVLCYPELPAACDGTETGCWEIVCEILEDNPCDEECDPPEAGVCDDECQLDDPGVG